MKKVIVTYKPKEDDSKIYDNILEYVNLSFAMEEKREISLIEQSGRMITSFSIVSAGLFVVYRIIRDFKIVPINYLNFFTIVCLMLLVASMILAVLVQWRWKYETLPAPLKIFDHINKNKESFNTNKIRIESYTSTLNNTYESKKKLNDKRAKLICSSMILFLIAVGVAIISTLYQVIIICCF